MKKHFYGAIATLIGTTIGAGILAIPYVTAKTGLLVQIPIIISIGLIVLLITLMQGEIVLRTKGTHQLGGYAEKYLGKTGKVIMSLAVLSYAIGAISAYIIGGGIALSQVFPINPTILSLLFFAFGAIILLFGLRMFEKSETILSALFIILIIAITIIALPHMKTTNITKEISPGGMLTSYGVVLFAFLGLFVVPEMKRELGKNINLLKKAIIISVITSAIIYILFASTTLVTGDTTTEVATVGLSEALGKPMQIISNIFAALAMMTSFIALGFIGKELLMYDYKIKKIISWGIIVLIPLSIALLKSSTFITLLSIAGTVSGTTIIILILLTFYKAKKKGNRKPEYKLNVPKIISYPLLIILIIIAAINLIL